MGSSKCFPKKPSVNLFSEAFGNLISNSFRIFYWNSFSIFSGIVTEITSGHRSETSPGVFFFENSRSSYKDRLFFQCCHGKNIAGYSTLYLLVRTPMERTSKLRSIKYYSGKKLLYTLFVHDFFLNFSRKRHSGRNFFYDLV